MNKVLCVYCLENMGKENRNNVNKQKQRQTDRQTIKTKTKIKQNTKGEVHNNNKDL